MSIEHCTVQYNSNLHAVMCYVFNLNSASEPCLQNINFMYEYVLALKVHKIEIFFGFDFEICIISLLVMCKY